MKKQITLLIILATSLVSLAAKADDRADAVWRCGTLSAVCISNSNPCAVRGFIDDGKGTVTTIETRNSAIRDFLRKNLYKKVYHQCAQGELSEDGQSIQAEYLGFFPGNPGVSGFSQ